MWTISRLIQKGNNENKVHLLVGKEYIVGRKDCHVLIKEDPSISRKHAVLTVNYDISCLGDTTEIPELKLTDSSKYGTSVNRVKTTQPTMLKDGDEILFGTHDSTFRVCYSPLVAVTSCLETNKKKVLKKQIHRLGGHLVNEWKSGQVDYLVMDGLVFTIKVIHALADCCHIVMPGWFDETVKFMEKQHTAPNPKMFLPPLKEETIKSDEPLFLPDQKRKTLFAGKTFCFLSNKQHKRTHEAIEMCHGMTVLLDLSNKRLQIDLRLVRDGCCMMMLDQKERESLSADGKECVSLIMDFLRRNKKRPIPESELGLAILEMNLTHYCNPNIDAVPAITQNIVCQSLNMGLDEMSQVYSPQNKQQMSQERYEERKILIQFKKLAASNSNKGLERAPQTGTKDSVKNEESAFSSTIFTPPKLKEVNVAKEGRRKMSVTETPESAMKSDKTKESVLKVSPIPETMNISDEGNVFVGITPTRKNSSKSDITSYFSTNKSRKEVVCSNSSFDDAIFFVKESKQSISVKEKEIIPDTLSFKASEFEHEKTNQRLAKNEISLQCEKSSVVPDSLRLSMSESEPETRQTTAFLVSSQVSASKTIISTKTAIPKSIRLNIGVNNLNSGQISHIKDSRNAERFAIPDSMEMDDIYEEHSKTSSQKFINVDLAPTGLSIKRRRKTEDEIDKEIECTTLPVKRMKKATEEQEETRFLTKQTSEEESSKGSSDVVRPGSIAKPYKSPADETRITQPNGFLSARFPVKKPPIVERPSKVNDESEESEFNEDDLPRNLVVVDVVSLVVRRPGEKKIAATTQISGKNFKKFKKQWYAGCDRRFPKIIGGNDLIVHQALSNVKHEDWFIEARELSQEQERRDRIEQELFMSDAGLPQRRRKVR